MMHRILRTWGVALTVMFFISAAAAQTACSVGYAITSQWPGGFGAALTIKNTGTTAISNWTLTWSFANGQTITQIWNASVAQSGTNVSVTNASYDGSIPAGGSLATVGFNGTWSGTNSIPASFALNGVTCGGAGTGSFTLSASTNSVAVPLGSSATDTINVADAGGFTGAVTLAASGLPSGVTATFGTNPATGTSVVTFAANSLAVAGSSTVTITGTSGTLTASTKITLTVTEAPGFTLTPSAASLSVVQGSTATDTITVTGTGGFTGAVTLAASGLPSGMTASFGTNPTTGSSVLTLTSSCSSTVGTATITITGTSGTLTASTAISLTLAVPVSGAFTIAPSAATLSVTQGGTATDTITATTAACSSSSVTFAASGLPTGVTAAFSPNPATGSSVLTFTASSSAKVGTSAVSVTGTSGSTSATTTIALTVNTLTPPGFTLAPSATSLSFAQGASGTDTIAVTDAGGFTGAVTLAAAGLPSGVTATFGTNPATGTSAVTFAASSTATTGTSTVTITGTSGTLTASTTIALTVTGTTSGFGCSVTYTITPQSSSSFGAAIAISNTGTTAWTGWTLQWTFANGQTIQSLWNGVETQSGALVTVTNESYNGSVAAGGSVSDIGFNGNLVGGNAAPTAFSVNGTLCGALSGDPPLAPTGLTATSGNATDLAFVDSKFDCYQLQRGTVDHERWTVHDGRLPTATSFTNTGLTNGTTYYYVVSAVNAAGTGPISSQVFATQAPRLRTLQWS